MDAIDPKIDYLLIDNLMYGGKHNEVMDYCKRMKCDLSDVLKLWFDASSPSGLMIENWYFDEYSVNSLSQATELVGVGGGVKFFAPGKDRIRISAESSFFELKKVSDLSAYKMRVRSINCEGAGWISEICNVTYNSITTTCKVMLEMDHWTGMKW